MDDDDAFLYGDSAPPAIPTSIPQPISLEYTKTNATNGVVANLEAQAEEDDTVSLGGDDMAPAEAEQEDEEGMDEGEDDESEDDIEIITERPSHSLDFRQRPSTQHVAGSNQSTTARAPGPSLTTEYTPRERGTPLAKSDPLQPKQESVHPPQQISATASLASAKGGAETAFKAEDDGFDPATLPSVQAPPSHPHIDPSQPGVHDNRSILEIDLSALAEKGWRRPGADISDWFNYGFDEISWEAYCYRRRELGETAAVLKAGVMNFAGMPEEQLTALPTEVRQMVMASANTVMSNGGAMPNPSMMQGPNAAMMQPGMMHDMAAMGMGMGGPPMGPGIGPGMMHPSMGPMGGVMGPTMSAMSGGGDVQGIPDSQGGNVAPVGDMGMDGGAFPGQGPQGQGMMGGMGMGGEFGLQDQNGMGQGMYPGMDQSAAGTPGSTGSGRGSTTPVPAGTGPGGFRGRGQMRGPAPGFGRGRGGRYVGQNAPGRVPSPLPPNVPTGPRSQNKYKDRDTNASASDNLDYGGGGGGGNGGRDSSHDDDRPRKRRGSPSYGPDARDPKRR